MIITQKQLEALEKAVETDLEDESVKALKIEYLLYALLEEVRRVHKNKDQFSESLALRMVCGLPWHLQFFKLFSEIPRG